MNVNNVNKYIAHFMKAWDMFSSKEALFRTYNGM